MVTALWRLDPGLPSATPETSAASPALTVPLFQRVNSAARSLPQSTEVKGLNDFGKRSGPP